jgi:hypothetical protein
MVRQDIFEEFFTHFPRLRRLAQKDISSIFNAKKYAQKDYRRQLEDEYDRRRDGKLPRKFSPQR